MLQVRGRPATSGVCNSRTCCALVPRRVAGKARRGAAVLWAPQVRPPPATAPPTSPPTPAGSEPRWPIRSTMHCIAAAAPPVPAQKIFIPCHWVTRSHPLRLMQNHVVLPSLPVFWMLWRCPRAPHAPNHRSGVGSRLPSSAAACFRPASPRPLISARTMPPSMLRAQPHAALRRPVHAPTTAAIMRTRCAASSNLAPASSF